MLASTFYYRNGKIHMTTTTFTVNITLNRLFNVLTSHSLTERQRGQRKECNEQHSLWCLVLLHEVDASTSIYLHRQQFGTLILYLNSYFSYFSHFLLVLTICIINKMFTTILNVLFMRMYGAFYEYIKSQQDKFSHFLEFSIKQKK